jgi:5-methylcytosine-specific restriction enzyme A
MIEMIKGKTSQYDNSPVIKRLYDSRRWRAAAKYFLFQEENQLCKICLSFGRETLATIVDHIIPHKGNIDLFWSSDNWQGLCPHCHSSIKKQIEAGKQIQGATVSGIPINPNKHWLNPGK